MLRENERKSCGCTSYVKMMRDNSYCGSWKSPHCSTQKLLWLMAISTLLSSFSPLVMGSHWTIVTVANRNLVWLWAPAMEISTMLSSFPFDYGEGLPPWQSPRCSPVSPFDYGLSPDNSLWQSPRVAYGNLNVSIQFSPLVMGSRRIN